jgi:hypothetical protein
MIKKLVIFCFISSFLSLSAYGAVNKLVSLTSLYPGSTCDLHKFDKGIATDIVLKPDMVQVFAGTNEGCPLVILPHIKGWDDGKQDASTYVNKVAWLSNADIGVGEATCDYNTDITLNYFIKGDGTTYQVVRCHTYFKK